MISTCFAAYSHAQFSGHSANVWSPFVFRTFNRTSHLRTDVIHVWLNSSLLKHLNCHLKASPFSKVIKRICTVQQGKSKWSNRSQIGYCLGHATTEIDGWPRKTNGQLSHAPRSYDCHFIAIRKFIWNYRQDKLQLEANYHFFDPCDLEILRKTLTKMSLQLIIKTMLRQAFCIIP